ncbi:hypothetical protein CS549_02995 [Porphyromonas gingivalis]|nr:hypothetical protein CS549_02995 [Porphyromonas gingivalis]
MILKRKRIIVRPIFQRSQFHIYVVQPGIEKNKLVNSPGSLSLLGATDLLLKRTGNEFYIITNK